MGAVPEGRTPAIVLGSASPRRRELLERAGVAFEVSPAGVDEGLVGNPGPVQAAEELAERKATAVAARLGPDRFVVGSDTVVAVGAGTGVERLLGKPGSPPEAAEMLRCLSGTTHRVVTGVSVVRTSDGLVRTSSECTRVTMRALSDSEVDAYVATGEWRDKAGGYAIQESADAFVTRLEGGGFDNVVGLPVALTLRLLGELGAIASEPESPTGR